MIKNIFLYMWVNKTIYLYKDTLKSTRRKKKIKNH